SGVSGCAAQPGPGPDRARLASLMGQPAWTRLAAPLRLPDCAPDGSPPRPLPRGSAPARKWDPIYAPRDFCASPNGLPSESLQIAHVSLGCTTLPPSASTRPSAWPTSLTAK